MLSYRKAWMAAVAVSLVVLALAAPAPAAPPSATPPAAASDLVKLLPNDTEAVFVINFKQLLDAPLLKKAGILEKIQEALKSNSDTQKAMTDLGFDPLKDLESVVTAQSGEDAEKGLMIMKGTFDAAKFGAKAEALAKDKKDNISIEKVKVDGADYTVYEVSKIDELIKLPPELAGLTADAAAKPVFVGVDKSALLVGASKEYVADALAKAAGKKKTELKSKEMQSLLAKVDPKQSVSMVLLAGVLARGPLSEQPDAKEALAKLDNITGGITVADGIKTQLILAAKSGKDAEDLEQKVNGGLTQAQVVVGIVVDSQKSLEPLLDIVKGVKTTTKDKTVTIDSDISGDVVRDLAKTLGTVLQRK